ncbi:MAG: M4 family metallopeptidase [Bacteroidota bacterium]
MNCDYSTSWARTLFVILTLILCLPVETIAQRLNQAPDIPIKEKIGVASDNHGNNFNPSGIVRDSLISEAFSPIPYSQDFSRTDIRMDNVQFLPWLNNRFEISQAISFAQISVEIDRWGNRHYAYQQYYKNIPIEHAILRTHSKNGIVQSFNGHIVNKLELHDVPSIDHSRALNLALHGSGFSHFLWDNPQAENYLKLRTQNPDTTYFPKGELIIVHRTPGKSPNNTSMRLAWKYHVLDFYDQQSKTMYIDATNGEVLGDISLVSHCQPGVGITTWYGGGKLIRTISTPMGYALQDDCDNGAIHTRDWNNGVSPFDYTNIDPNHQWDRPTDRVSVTSHWGARRSRDYFEQVFGRIGWDNQASPLCVFNGVPSASGSQQNATFSAYTGTMSIGMGSGNPEDYYNTIDIVAHELTHGVTASSANLVYRGESGALNESFSDIFGTAVEFWLDAQGELGPGNAPADWLIGEDRSSGAIRSLEDPRSLNHPDTYGKGPWIDPSSATDYGGVHTNSGVLNYWFYLLAMGGSGTNDDSHAYSVTGIGFDRALEIAYEMLTVHLTASSTFSDARELSILAAMSIPNPPSNAIEQINLAWDAVGVQPDITFTGNYSTPYIKNTMLSYKVRVENNGGLAAHNVKVAFQLVSVSTGNVIELGDSIIPYLPPHTAQVAKFNLNMANFTPQLPPGDYGIQFVLDPDNDLAEKDESNNIGSWSNPRFTMPNDQKSNLDFPFWYGFASFDGNLITYNHYIRNTGNAVSPSTTVGYYLSANDNLDANDFFLGSSTLNALQPGDSVINTFTVDVANANPTPPSGIYYVIFHLDDGNVIDERSEADNDGYFIWQKYSYGAPNLTFQRGFSTPQWKPFETQVLSIASKIYNYGSVSSGSSTLKYYLSINDFITTSDILIGETTLPSIPSGQYIKDTLEVDISSIIPAISAGEYYIAFIIDADNMVAESDEGDNTAYWDSPKYQYDLPQANLSHIFDPLFMKPTISSGGIQAEYNVGNYGSEITGSYDVSFYLSTDTIIDVNDFMFYSVSVPPTSPGTYMHVSTPIVDIKNDFPNLPDVSYFVGVLVDPNDVIAETKENDNAYYWMCPLYQQRNQVNTSIDELFDTETLVVFPNPAMDQVSIAFESNVEQNLEVLLLNQLGQPVYSDQFEIDKGSIQRSISLNGIANGMYFISIRFGDKTFIRKVQVMH